MTRRDPFDEIEDLLERMGREFEELGGTLEGTGPEVPRFPGARDVDVDVIEDDEAVTVVADLPGFDADDVDVEFRDDALVITGSREEATEFDVAGADAGDDDGGEADADAADAAGDGAHEADDEVRYHRRERRLRSVSRRIPIPEPVEADAATASFDAGVLTVTLPKRSPDDDRGHTIDVS